MVDVSESEWENHCVVRGLELLVSSGTLFFPLSQTGAGVSVQQAFGLILEKNKLFLQGGYRCWTDKGRGGVLTVSPAADSSSPVLWGLEIFWLLVLFSKSLTRFPPFLVGTSVHFAFPALTS